MEYITIGGTKYECQKLTTETDAISITLVGQDIAEVTESFKNETALTVSNEENEIYGIYSDLTFKSATVYANGSICVAMHIPSEEELWKAKIEASQAEQDEILAELLLGGEE